MSKLNKSIFWLSFLFSFSVGVARADEVFQVAKDLNRVSVESFGVPVLLLAYLKDGDGQTLVPKFHLEKEGRFEELLKLEREGLLVISKHMMEGTEFVSYRNTAYGESILKALQGKRK